MVGMGTSIILSRWLGPADKGAYSLLFLIVSLSSLFVTFGLGSANVYLGSRRPSILTALIGNSTVGGTIFGLSAASLIFFATYHSTVQTYLAQNAVKLEWVRTIVWILPIILLNSFLREVVRAAGRIVSYNIIDIVSGISSLIGLLGLVVLTQFCLVGAIFVNVASTLVTSLVILFNLRSYIIERISVSWPLFKESFSFGLRLYIGNISQFLNYRLDVFLVAYYLAPIYVGYYVTATGLAEKMWELPHAIRTVLLHRVSAMTDIRDAIGITTRTTRMITVVMALLCALLSVSSYALIGLMYGQEYLPAATVLIGLMPGIWFFSIGKLLAIHLSGTGHPEVGTISALVSLVVTVILDLLLIPPIGILGASIASSVSYIVSTVVIVVFFVRIHQCRLRDIFWLRKSDLIVLWAICHSIMQQRRLMPTIETIQK